MLIVRQLARAAFAAWVLACASAHAASTSLVGQLDPNNAQDVLLYPFTLTAPGAVTIQSWGYGGSSGAPGGVNAQGAAIAGGGFDPYVSLFSGTGSTATLVDANDDGACPPGTIADALCGDSTLVTAVLPAGSYTLAVSAFLNMSLAENLGSGTLGDGFVGLGSYGTRTSAYAVDISGPTVAAPTLLLSHSPNGLTFGPQTSGETSGPLVVIVTNTGTSAVGVGGLTLSGPDAAAFSVTTACGGTLAPAATCAITVRFTPMSIGPKSATLSLDSTASNAPHVIALGGTGTGDLVPMATLSTTTLDFGTLPVGSTATLPLVAQNVGGEMLAVASVSIAGSPDFTILSDGCSGQSIAGSSSCTVSVRFVPSSPGGRSATLTLVSDASNSPAQVAIVGAGAVPLPRANAVPTISHLALTLLAALVALAGAGARRRFVPGRSRS